MILSLALQLILVTVFYIKHGWKTFAIEVVGILTYEAERAKRAGLFPPENESEEQSDACH